jgi:hypothetical protein
MDPPGPEWAPNNRTVFLGLRTKSPPGHFSWEPNSPRSPILPRTFLPGVLFSWEKCPRTGKKGQLGHWTSAKTLVIYYRHVLVYSISSIQAKWTPKSALVKRRPPTTCRLYFVEFAVPSTSISSSDAPVLAHLANAPHPRSLPSTFTTPLCLSFFGRSDCAPPDQPS